MEFVSWDLFFGWISMFVDTINNLFNTCIKLLRINPFDSLDSLATNVVAIVQGTALMLLTLFFLMEFFKKSMDLQWIKWENILMFSIKVLFAKVILDNTVNIMKYVFGLFNSLSLRVSGALANYEDADGNAIVTFLKIGTQEEIAGNFLTPEEIVFYRDDGGFLGLARSLKEMELFVPLVLIELVLLVTEVIIFARVFEIIIYTMISPIPLSTFIGDEYKQIGMNFVKGFAAVCLQGVIIITVFIIFTQMSNLLTIFQDIGLASGSSGILFKSAALAIAVIKSGSWAKKMCGAM